MIELQVEIDKSNYDIERFQHTSQPLIDVAVKNSTVIKKSEKNTINEPKFYECIYKSISKIREYPASSNSHGTFTKICPVPSQ